MREGKLKPYHTVKFEHMKIKVVIQQDIDLDGVGDKVEVVRVLRTDKTIRVVVKQTHDAKEITLTRAIDRALDQTFYACSYVSYEHGKVGDAVG
jgi:hypothetical protein